MQKQWLAATVGLALAMGTVAGTGLMMQAGADDVKIETGWRFDDGYWNYWDADDRAWYYTDGRHWYTYGDGDAWTIYKFDRGFGKKVYREGYAAPGPDVAGPRHKIKVKVKK